MYKHTYINLRDKRTMRQILVLIAFAAINPVHAQIYQHVDDLGHVTISNIPVRTMQMDESPDDVAVKSVAAKGRAKTHDASTTKSSPSDFPQVDAAQQKSRDGTRLEILKNELATEERLQQEAAKAGQGEAAGLHSRNAETIRKELGMK